MNKLILTVILALISNCISAQIIFHDISPDTTVNSWGACRVGVDGKYAGNSIYIWWYQGPEVLATCLGCQLLFDSTGSYPEKLNEGDNISLVGMWDYADNEALNANGNGNWQSEATDKYLGFRFQENGKWHYGWLKMTVAQGGASFTVKEWARNNAGNGIKAGEKNSASINDYNRGQKIQVITEGSRMRFTGLENNIKYELRMINMNGREVLSSYIYSNESVDLQLLSSGIYSVLLNSSGKVRNFKVTVQ